MESEYLRRQQDPSPVCRNVGTCISDQLKVFEHLMEKHINMMEGQPSKQGTRCHKLMTEILEEYRTQFGRYYNGD
jgi:hypothetical protein|tara:strand:+ start:10684 stop:10908 length:225 start_codon:yes stop_codon:yes gene_type:complete